LLNHRELTLQDAEVVSAALLEFRDTTNVEFSDCLILAIARKAGHVPVGTFDREVGKLEGVRRLR
jgi:predicted nucleic-acid-binding protein